AAQPDRLFGDPLRRGGVGERVDLARLGDVPVLAEAAAQVAARGAEREHAGSGQEVVERLLLDRVHAEAAGAAVSGEDDRVVLARADETESALPLVESAVPRAEIALHAAVVERVPVAPGHVHAAALPVS